MKNQDSTGMSDAQAEQVELPAFSRLFRGRKRDVVVLRRHQVAHGVLLSLSRFLPWAVRLLQPLLQMFAGRRSSAS